MSPLPETFTTKISLFQEDYIVTFVFDKDNSNAIHSYSASFKIPGFMPECYGLLSASISKDFLSGKRSMKHNGLDLFSSIDLMFCSDPEPKERNRVLDFHFPNDSIRQNPKNKKDFRNWPKNLFAEIWQNLNHELASNSFAQTLSVTKNNRRVFLLQTLNWSDPLPLKQEFPKLLSAIFRTFEETPLVSGDKFMTKNKSLYWETEHSKVGCIPKDIPIKDLAMFCLATGRFPMKNEVSLMRDCFDIKKTGKRLERD